MKQTVVQQWRPKVWDQLADDVKTSESEKSITSSIEVTDTLVQSIKRKRGKMKQKIEVETKTTLSISKNKSACFIVVKGSSDEAVQQARVRIQALLEKEETKTDSAKDHGEGTKSKQHSTAVLKKSLVGSLQWIPKNEVRSMHTTTQSESWDKLKDMVFSHEDGKDEEKISGSVQVDKKLLRLIKGQKNEVKERIEKATKTTIRIGIPVVVEGSSEDSVREAVEEIEKIVEEAVNDSKFQYSHFISLPLNMHPSLVKQLEAFQEAVMTLHGISLAEEEPATAGAAAATDSIGEDETELGNDRDSKGEVEASTQEAAGITKVEEVSPQEAAAITEVFQQSVMGSLGLPGNNEQEKVEAVLQETVLASLGLKHESAEDPMKELADEPAAASHHEKVSEKVEDNSGHILKEATDHDDHAGQLQMEIETGTPQLQNEPENEMLEHVDTEAFQNSATQNDAEQTGQLQMEIDQVQDEPEGVGGVSEVSVSATKVDNVEAILDRGGDHTNALEESKDEYVPLQEVSFTAKKKGSRSVSGSASGSASEIDRSIFIKPSRFHLTVLMLKLWNEEMVNQAHEVLQKCLPDVVSALEGKPVSVSLRGLEIMKGSPKNTRVLYAKVADADGGERLSQACQVIINAFVESGLVLGKDREQVLKLHATVMNTSHRKRKNRYNNKGFDATEILSKFGEECWGDYQIMEAHLSQRFKYDENEYYHCCGSIPFPGNDQKLEDSLAAHRDKEESTEQDSKTENEETQTVQQNCWN